VDEPEFGVAPRQHTISLVVPCAQFSDKNGTTVVPQPPYSPDLAPADFFLFPKLKSALKGRRFDIFDEIEKKSKKGLFAILKEAFQKAFQSW
jgi:transposase